MNADARKSYLLPLLSTASTRFVVCDSCHHFFQVLMDVDAGQIASSASEAQEHLLSNLPSPKQVTVFDNAHILK